MPDQAPIFPLAVYVAHADRGIKPQTLAARLVQRELGPEVAQKREQNPVAPYFENSLRRASHELTSAYRYFRRSREWLDMFGWRRAAAKEDRERAGALLAFNAGAHAFGRAVGAIDELKNRNEIPLRWARLFDRKIRLVVEEQGYARYSLLSASKSFNRRRLR